MGRKTIRRDGQASLRVMCQRMVRWRESTPMVREEATNTVLITETVLADTDTAECYNQNGNGSVRKHDQFNST